MNLPLTAAAAALFAATLVARYLKSRSAPLAERIDAALPQTQCRQCGYAGCRPYAEAIAAGEAINCCPPGGERVIRRLAAITGRPPLPLDTTRGVHKPPQVARIEEERCIGCTLCIQACPVDAIVGAPKLMHTVIAEDCTGCELCLPPCPVDCIVLVPRPVRAADWLPGARDRQARAWRRLHEQRNARLERERRRHAERMAAKAAARLESLDPHDAERSRKQAIIQAALERARARRAAQR